MDATTNNDWQASRTAKLTWSAVSGATHYEIQRFNPGARCSHMGGSDRLVTNWTDGFIAVADAGASPSWEDVITTSSDTEGAGQTYYYVVSAVD